MKNIFFTVLCSFILVQVALGQTKTTPNQLVINWLGIDSYSPWKEELYQLQEQTAGVSIEYGRYLGKSFSLQLPLRTGTVNYPFSVNDYFPERRFYSGDLLLQYGFLVPENKTLQPFIRAGIGFHHIPLLEFDALTEAHYPVGLGLKINLYKGLSIQLSSEYRFSNGPDMWHNGIGLAYAFGKKKEEAPTLPTPGNLDVDNDGVTDNLDKCPDLAGLKTLDGCPDDDGDGIHNDIDKCPSVPGSADTQGCPDRDGDGIPDHEDFCPDVKGLSDLSGCPNQDSDNDGLADIEDKCPHEAGVFEMAGCPDTDGDFIEDKYDECPTEKGGRATKGCPDADGDGIADHLDACPDIFGDISNDGCPFDKRSLENNIKYAPPSIDFNTSSIELSDSAFEILDQLAEVLTNNQVYLLSIEGHTDNTGNPVLNQRLSEKRAKACFFYLVDRGVAEDRMNYIGFGEIRPIYTNTTPEGRAKNRRVEFRLFIR